MAAVGRLNRQFWNNGVCNEPKKYDFDVSFELDGSNDPTNLRGRNVKVARSTTGEYTIELPQKFNQMVCATATLEATGLVNAVAHVDSYSSSTRKVTVKVERASDVPSIDAPAYLTSQTVTTHVHTAAEAGYVVAVEATTGTYTGRLEVLTAGTPTATSEVTVTYDGAGVPTLTFAAADAVTACSYLLIPTAGTAAESAAAVDLDGPRLNVRLTMQLSPQLTQNQT